MAPPCTMSPTVVLDGSHGSRSLHLVVGKLIGDDPQLHDEGRLGKELGDDVAAAGRSGSTSHPSMLRSSRHFSRLH